MVAKLSAVGASQSLVRTCPHAVVAISRSAKKHVLKEISEATLGEEWGRPNDRWVNDLRGSQEDQ